jgi:hypothetical protein
MPRATPLPVREKLWQRAQQGDSPAVLAHTFRLPLRTVRHLLQRFRQAGAEALKPAYRCPTAPADPTAPAWRAQALDLRRQHPTWGAPFVRVVLQEQYPQQLCPEARTLQRWFRQAGLTPARPGRRRGATLPYRRAQRPHEVWQMDASEYIALATGERLCWLRVVDECSGAVLQTVVFPPPLVEPATGARHPDATASAL